MRCEEARLLVSALVDHELSDAEELAASEHIESCPVCARLAEDYRRMGQHIAVGYRQAPAGLADKIRASIARERRVYLPSRSYATMRRAAVLIFCMGLSALATWYAMRSSQEQALL